MTKKKDLERELVDAGRVKLSGTGAQHDKFRHGGCDGDSVGTLGDKGDNREEQGEAGLL